MAPKLFGILVVAITFSLSVFARSESLIYSCESVDIICIYYDPKVKN